MASGHRRVGGTTKEVAVAAGYLAEAWDETLLRPRCLAKSKQRQDRCLKWPIRGKRVCYHHGGAPGSGRPPTHGRYSQLLPSHLADRYRQSLADPDFLSLRDEIALLDARIGELVGELMGGGGEWAAVETGLDRVRIAVSTNDVQLMASALAAIQAQVTAGAKVQAIWGAVVPLLEQRRKLAETERRRIVDAQQMVTLEQMMALLAVVRDAINTHITDGPTRARIADELRTLARGHALPPQSGRRH